MKDSTTTGKAKPERQYALLAAAAVIWAAPPDTVLKRAEVRRREAVEIAVALLDLIEKRGQEEK